MFAAFRRSWQLTRIAFAVIRRDPELLALPVLSALCSIGYALALAVPAFFALRALPADGRAHDPVLYLALGAFYFGLAFLTTFFNTAVVYIAKVRFEGGDATLGQGLGFALSRAARIAGWSALSASVGVLLRAIERAAERAGGAGGLVLDLVRGMLGMTFGVAALFVVPAMVYRDLGPIDALRASVGALSRTWGESLIRQLGLGLVQLLGVVLGLVAAGLLATLFAERPVALWIVLGLAGAYQLALALTFAVATTVFNTALFAYAQTGAVPRGFDSAQLRDAFRPR